ncbi:speckle-type POZ protein-like isoform X1 [Planococcus citri]|uniref:speckle-type POZ protein-like isoform X1 n=1 Tax=Planococcus citri TaxID=170843 RepID=UPI0031F772B8
MNPFYIICMVFFASYCSTQAKHNSNNINSENVARYDTYLYTGVSKLKYIWAIHNFSDHEKLETGEILSPQFSAPKTDPEWYIKITPHGTDKKNETISVDVYLCNFFLIEEASAKYAISIINNKKESLWSRNSTKFMKFQTGCSHGWSDFCKKNDFFRSQLLQNDTLMLLIHITMVSESSPRNYRRKTLPRCDTYLSKQIREKKYIWAIHNFSVHEANHTPEISSSNFKVPTTRRYKWNIEINPNSFDNRIETITLKACQWCVEEPHIVGLESVEINVSAINDKKEAIISASATFKEPDENSFLKEWSPFCTKDDFFRNRVLQNDTLTWLASLKWTFPHTHVISNRYKASSPRPLPKTTAIEPNISQSYESMLENPKLADVIFTINGSTYPAHSEILAARSPVFAAMLQRKHTKNGKIKKIRISVTNMNEQVLRAMLRYIYTGRCENSGKLADELLVVAVKYGLDGLRKFCEEERSKTLMG